MTIIKSLLRHPLRHHIYQRLQQIPRGSFAGFTAIRQNFHGSTRQWTEHSDLQRGELAERGFTEILKEYKESYDAPKTTFLFGSRIDLDKVGRNQTATGFLTKINLMSSTLAFAHVTGDSHGTTVQIVLRGSELVQQLKNIKLNSPITVTGIVKLKYEPKGQADKTEQIQDVPNIKHVNRDADEAERSLGIPEVDHAIEGRNKSEKQPDDLDINHEVKEAMIKAEPSSEGSEAKNESLGVDGMSAPLPEAREVNDEQKTDAETFVKGTIFFQKIEIQVTSILCLNSFPANFNANVNHVFPPQSRHLQIRHDEELKKRLLLRSQVAGYIRSFFSFRKFHEIETPILFKSTPEGAREFLVPTRKPGLAYALPQSPQQYKQILMASGIHQYFQFARCFRDEDLRADRQPEFTQIDLELAFSNGQGVMLLVEKLIKNLYWELSKDKRNLIQNLTGGSFYRMQYAEAMSQHGSDKPDLRIPHLIHRVDTIITPDLRGMLTSIIEPAVEVCKIRLLGSSKTVQAFIRKFMDSPDAEVFSKNPDGPPGLCIVDPGKPMGGLQIFGFEGAQAVTDLFNNLKKPKYHNDGVHAVNIRLEEGDLVLIQAREPGLNGGSTVLGKLRLALFKAALAEGLVASNTEHKYLWVTDFPMFTLDDGVDPGQGGTAGFSATHHPFTAPKTPADIDLLLTDPLTAIADHYDLVVNGIELGGGSRRIHSAEIQKFVMRDILKMSEERMNDFSHLFDALSVGCPPHAGLAIGFDRLMAVLTGRESVKDVIAFPKSSKGEDMMVKSPSRITDKELKTYHLRFDLPRSNQAVQEDAEMAPEEVIEEIRSQPPSHA